MRLRVRIPIDLEIDVDPETAAAYNTSLREHGYRTPEKLKNEIERGIDLTRKRLQNLLDKRAKTLYGCVMSADFNQLYVE